MVKNSVKAIRLDIGSTEIFERIDLSSKGHQDLKLVCASHRMNVVFTFRNFLEIENREETLSPEEEATFVFDGANGPWNTPVFWVPYPELSNHMAKRSVAWYKDSTKLWMFLSQSNSIKVYSNQIPQLSIQEQTQGYPDILSDLGFRSNDSTSVEVLIPRPMFFSDLDESLFDRSVQEISAAPATSNEENLVLTLHRSNDPVYLKNVVGFFVRYKLDLCALRALITESNQSYLYDPLKTVG